MVKEAMQAARAKVIWLCEFRLIYRYSCLYHAIDKDFVGDTIHVHSQF
jgi:hypothetical protein